MRSQFWIVFQLIHQHVIAQRDVKIPRTGDFPQIPQCFVKLARHGATIVDVIGAAIRQHEIGHLVA